jgi:hypothetical protein
MARFIKMFPTYLVIFLLGNIASMIRESVTKPPFGLSYVNKILTSRFLASDSLDNICGNTVDKTINFECLLICGNTVDKTINFECSRIAHTQGHLQCYP